MKGGMRSRRHHQAVDDADRRTAREPGNHARHRPSRVALIAVAARHALNPTFAPTDRSSPAVRITSVSPDASRKTRLAWRSTLSRFDAVRNASLSDASSHAQQRDDQQSVAERRQRPTRPASGDRRAESDTLTIGPHRIDEQRDDHQQADADDLQRGRHRQQVESVLQHAHRQLRRAACRAASRCRARTTCRRR